MDVSRLPRHIVNRVEKKWAHKLQEQARDWQSAKPDRYLTDRGVPVVRRSKRQVRKKTTA
jgi:hypothetical protein